MIVVKIKGGLGNQMFQYAFGQYIQRAYRCDCILYDWSIYNRESIHNGFELEQVFDGINVLQASSDELSRVHTVYEYSAGSILDKIARKRQRLIFDAAERIKKRRYDEFEWMKIPEEKKIQLLNGDVYLDGDWTVLPYYRRALEDNAMLFRFNTKCFTQKDNEIERLICDCYSVSVHIRGGDYKGSSFEFVDKQFYLNAIERIKRINPNCRFFIFTDDFDYAFSLLGNDGFYVRGNTGSNSWKDMYFMSRCKANILANSTFSFWAAILNENEGKPVIAPCLNSSKTNYFLPYENEWIVL